VALFHDVVITMGVFSFLGFVGFQWFDVEMNQNLIAALLTIIGFSINDTVVVFDRIRENVNEHKGMELGKVYDLAIDQTLSRTIITSLTVFLTTLVLFIFGGDSIRGFVFAFMIGVIVGTYSSIFVASGIAYDMQVRNKKDSDDAAAPVAA
jgi:SecD/SecF fusion protein